MCRICQKVISATQSWHRRKLTQPSQKKAQIHSRRIIKDTHTLQDVNADSVINPSHTLYNNVTPYPTSSDRHKLLTAANKYFLTKDMQPNSAVEGEGFRKMDHAFDKRYALPSRYHFSRIVLPNMYCTKNVQLQKKCLKGITSLLDTQFILDTFFLDFFGHVFLCLI